MMILIRGFLLYRTLARLLTLTSNAKTIEFGKRLFLVEYELMDTAFPRLTKAGNGSGHLISFDFISLS